MSASPQPSHLFPFRLLRCLTNAAEVQRSCWTLSLWPPFSKFLGLTYWKPASTLQLYIPFTPSHDLHLETVKCLCFVTKMHKTALVLWLKIQQRENRVAQAAWQQPTFQPRWVYPCLKSPRRISETWVSILLQDFALWGEHINHFEGVRTMSKEYKTRFTIRAVWFLHPLQSSEMYHLPYWSPLFLVYLSQWSNWTKEVISFSLLD